MNQYSKATHGLHETAAHCVMQNCTRFVSLEAQVRSTVSTDEAAFHLGRKPQTLRKWACYEDGPIRPIRINGRLAWRIADLQRVLNEGSAK